MKKKPAAPLRSPSELDKLLETKSFVQLLKDGDIYDVKTASEKSGYTPQHIRRICREGRIPHFTRALPTAPEEFHVYFFPHQIKSIFSYRKAVGRPA